MSVWRRACLYIRRKTGKSVLLALVMLLLFSFAMVGMLFHSAADAAIGQVRQSIGGGFRIAPDLRNPENVEVSDTGGNVEVSYVGEPLDGRRIRAVLDSGRTEAYNAVVRGNALMQEDVSLVDYNEIYQNDAVASRLVTVEADTDYLLSAAFEKGQLRPAEHAPAGTWGENTALVSEALALRNHLEIGEEIRLSPTEGGGGAEVSVKIVGFFTVETEQPNTDVAAPVHLLENKVFLDLHSGAALTGAEGADYADFFVSDPAKVYEIMEEIQRSDLIGGNRFAVTARAEEYEKAAGPLLRMRKLADAMLAMTGAVSVAVLSLIQALFNRCRRHEMGIMLSVGISKAEILLQRFFETAVLAAAAFALSGSVSLAVRPRIIEGVGNAKALGEMCSPGCADAAAMLLVTAGCGMWVLFVSVVISNLWVMRLSPGRIFSELS